MLQGKPEAVRRAFFALKERCAQVGLQVNDAKCNAYSRNRGAAQSVGAATGATHALRGLVDPCGEVVDDVCLRTVLPQVHKHTPLEPPPPAASGPLPTSTMGEAR